MARSPKAAVSGEAPTPSKQRSQAYSAAEKRLREAHPDEFHGYMAEECAKVGVEYTRKLTPQEKAAQTVATLVAQFGTDVIPAEALPQVISKD